MSEASLSSYEEVPYQSKPLYPTHPDCMATLATLLGMRPAPANGCRVLELGCATGGNLIPMAAALPGSRFVGIDLAPSQVEAGREMIGQLGLTNIELLAQSILDVDDALGEFDYVICHGVYSWVPPQVQEKILDVCKSNLSPQGVAYISYNTYPGWHSRALVRDIMRFHARQFADPDMRVQQARACLTFLMRALPDKDSTYARILREESAILSEQADFYLFHEHLEDTNQPCYFHEFAGRAAAKGLQYLGDARTHNVVSDLPKEIRDTLQAISSDLIRLEQYTDFLRDRAFRRTLLCHDDVPLDRETSPQVVMGLHATATARPEAESAAVAGEVEAFRGDDGRTISTNIPVVKTALRCLYEAWPRALSFAELWQATGERLGEAASGQGPEVLAASLLECYLSGLAGLHVHPPRFAVEVSERPVAFSVARLQAEATNAVANFRHRLVILNDFDRLVLRYLDGSRDRAGILDAILEVAGRGGLTVETAEGPPAGPEALRAILGRETEDSLRSLAGSALLIA